MNVCQFINCIQMQRKIEFDRIENENRRKKETARDSSEREKREKERRKEREEEKKKDEKEREEYERMKNTDATEWNEKMSISEAEFNKMKEKQEKELSRVKEEQEKTMLKMMEDAEKEREMRSDRLRKEREKVAQEYEEYCSKWRNQMKEMLNLMQQRIWNQQVEQKWAKKLSGLRDVHLPVHRSFFNLRFDLEDLTKYNGADLSASKRSEIEVKVSLLLDQLKVEIQIMGNEVDEMKNMTLDQPEAKFLADIEESAESIGKASTSLFEKMEIVMKHLKSEYEKLLEVDDWRNCGNSFNDLEKKVDLIPTVSGLKMKYDQ
ncbi:hypothetical protein PFISCL1PPCAC_5488 [Pristionchus fissidentatus]|uniref:Uncharacterized protein n=1 Tax=Pristionchus fissidentatus TaxID=1538716 RepID=A0AAV5V5W2_9BILA|nr:hypothetical protein PFISCL1PPCAC_5488 [Pristionchus fissidentatus]